MEKEETLLRKRLIELSNNAYQRGIIMYSDFLNLNELNILHTTPKDSFPMDEESIRSTYPIRILKISPLQPKFAEELSHRDYLGALLNLGITRAKTGDILIHDKEAYVFVHQELTEFLVKELTRVRHTTVRAVEVENADFKWEPKYEEIKGTVASVRLDSLLSLAFSSSRSKLTALIEAGRVYVNGKLITSNGYHVKDNDIISVRQMGRFQYEGVLSETKKGRYYITIRKYI